MFFLFIYVFLAELYDFEKSKSKMRTEFNQHSNLTGTDTVWNGHILKRKQCETYTVRNGHNEKGILYETDTVKNGYSKKST